VQLALAQALLSRNDLPGARKAIQAAVDASPKNGAISNAAGLLLMDAQKYDEALARFRAAAEIDSKAPGYWLNAALAQLALDQPAPARDSLDRALAIQPGWVDAESVKVLLDLRTSGTAVALSSARALRRKNPREAAPAILEGDIQMKAQQYKDAALAYSDAERLKADSATAVKLHNAMRLANQPKPEEPLERWLDRRPNDGAVRMVLAQYYMNTNRANEAIGEYETFLKSGAGNPIVLNNLAWFYDTNGREEAEATARKAYELAPKNPSIADTYGWILLRKQKIDAALPLLAAAAQGASEDPSVQFHYSVALAKSGRKNEARDLLTKLMEKRTEFADRAAAEELLKELRG